MTEFARPQLRGLDRAKLDVIIEPIVRAHEGEVVDLEWKSEQAGWVLRVLVEKLGSDEQRLSTEDSAVDLELCSNISKELSPALDVADIIPNAYHLEVGSPGVERVLRGERDFRRFEGKKAKLKLETGVDGQTVIVGTLGPVEADRVSVIDGDTTHQVPLSDVASARLVFEFGPAPRPGKPGSKAGKTKTRSA